MWEVVVSRGNWVGGWLGSVTFWERFLTSVRTDVTVLKSWFFSLFFFFFSVLICFNY
jgi:hypothetical protein